MSDAKNNEDNERTTATGLFNYAVSYQESAKLLARTKIKGITHPDSPIEFLYVHSIELFLKAYLRLSYDVSKITSIRHNFKKLVAVSVKQGMAISDSDRKILELIHTHNLNLNTRYITTGFRANYPTIESLGEVCDHLQASVKEQFTTVGLRVR